MIETVRFEYDCAGDEASSIPATRTTVSLSGEDLKCGLVVRKFAELLIASGWSNSNVNEYIPSWSGLD
ncbi:MAG: hypothetical protein E6Q97_19835 [Desulfurellales bacterium]|nr:MAG: hypothetical protein E6Q97_19835 [Desulfurellales bacterium]